MATELAQARRDASRRATTTCAVAPAGAARARRRSTPTTTTGWRCAFRWPRSAACRCGSTIPTACARRFPATSPRSRGSSQPAGGSRGVTGPVPVPVIAVDGPAASGKGTVAAGRRPGARLPPARQRLALPAGRAEGAARAACALGRCGGAGAARRRARRALRRRRASGSTASDVTDAIRTEEVGVARLAGGRPPGGACGAARAAARLPRSRRGWSPTAATWAPSCSRTPPLKVFVTASAEERARRRHKQLIEKGISVTH